MQRRGHRDLGEYSRKRDPRETPEPFGGDGGPGAPRFVVQRHAARSLHYDFRLERDGVLASWAVPKGIPLEPGQRVLAVHVEDHPLDYAAFEGEIPAGQYGAGTVEIWDRGTYELLEQKRDGGLTVHLHGKRLEGLWALVPAKLGGKKDRKAGSAPGSGFTPVSIQNSSARIVASTCSSLLAPWPNSPFWYARSGSPRGVVST